MTDCTKGNSIETWQLVYPIGFLLNLIECGIKNLKKYFEDNHLNPYDCYKFGDYWIDELN
jgi:hypothetical protein